MTALLQQGKPLMGREGYGTYEEFPLVQLYDVDGNELHEGDYVQCIATDHNWLKPGQLVMLNDNRPHSVEGQYSLNYTDLKGSQSGISNLKVRRVDMTREDRIGCELQWYYHQLARATDRLASAHGEKIRLETIIRQIESARNV